LIAKEGAMCDCKHW